MAAQPVAVALADFDNDGVVDAAVSTGTTGPEDASLLIMQGRGDGTFEDVQQIALAAQASFLSCGLFDGDEFCDHSFLDPSLIF